MKVYELESGRKVEVPDEHRLCPACKGEGEYGETRYQPVEGMGYMDAPAMCPYCMPAAKWQNYSDFLSARGYVKEDEHDGICDEIGVCYDCHEPCEAATCRECANIHLPK